MNLQPGHYRAIESCRMTIFENAVYATLRDNCLVEAGFRCAGCGEWNVTTVDESAGRRQSYVEDCQTCCKPNVLHVDYDAASREFVILAALE